MLLFNEKGKTIRFKTDQDNFINKGMNGNIYRTSVSTCVKVYNGRSLDVDPEVLKFIRSLSLRNFYEIYDLLYTRSGNFKGYVMKYYDASTLDILTLPTDYTLDNLYILQRAILTLTSNNIWAVDLHDDNVILGDNTITVIDADLYCFNRIYSEEALKAKNIKAVNYLFYYLYTSALNKYHKEYAGNVSNSVMSLFSTCDDKTYTTVKKLAKYKYPIDYFKASSKR